MNSKVFIVIISMIILVGIITSIGLVQYTIELRKNLSITSYIANEEDC